MKNKSIIFLLALTTVFVTAFYSCKKSFLDIAPQGVYSEAQLTNGAGLNGILISAYSTLAGRDGSWYEGGSNWVWGSVLGGDALKGSEYSDQVDINPVMKYSVGASSPPVNGKWNGIWDGVAQANGVIRAVKALTSLDPGVAEQIEAEAKFLRGYHHFEGKKCFKNIPYLDENVTDFKVPNTTDGTTYVEVWPQIEADFQFAYDHLLATKENKGRINKWGAAVYLAKAYLFQAKWAEAKALLDVIIVQGTTAEGKPYALTANYHENFRVITEHNTETVFAIEASYGDGSTQNGNYDETLAFPHSNTTPGAGCCGFFQPSQDFVNSFRTGTGPTDGLPLPANYNDVDVTSDAALLSSDPFTPYAGNLDPRLDWSVGRRGIPYLDWGAHPGRSWIRKVGFGGPYSPKKNVFYKSDLGATAGSVGWGWNNTALNFTLERFSDVLLMAAEADIEVGGQTNIDAAQVLINLVRARAANSPVPGAPATYNVKQYTATWNQAEARTALHFERKLELGMEGHRFFDLVRWGEAATFINTVYLPLEAPRYAGDNGNFPLSPAVFTLNKNEYLPIPEDAISKSIKGGEETLKQNPNY